MPSSHALAVGMSAQQLTALRALAAVYVFISYRLFILTNTLKDVVVPNKVGREMTRNFVTLAVTTAVLFVAGAIVIRASGLHDITSSYALAANHQHFDP